MASTCAPWPAAFAIHIGLEHFRLRNSPGRIAWHAALAVALGALGLAAAANLHGYAAGAGHPVLLAMALVITIEFGSFNTVFGSPWSSLKLKKE